MFSSKILAVTKTTSKYIAGLLDPFKDKSMNGQSNYKLKSLKINPSYSSFNFCKWKDYQNIFILSILNMKHKCSSSYRNLSPPLDAANSENLDKLELMSQYKGILIFGLNFVFDTINK